MKTQLTIAWMYPDLMSTYGDRGNVIVLKKRCEWRDIGIKIEEITIATSTSKLKNVDLIFMGGAQDRQQKIAGPDFLHNKAPMMKSLIDAGIPALIVCAGYQAVGHYYKPYQGEPIPGPGILDLYTEHPGDQKERLVGNVSGEIINPTEIAGTTIVGFENHGGRTYLGEKLKPFARVTSGGGNNGEDGYEGAVYRNTIGCYYHGPLLPKNPAVADWLIKKALEIKYQKKIELQILDNKLEKEAKKAVSQKFT